MDDGQTGQDTMKDWIEHIADTVHKYYADRQIVLWGKYQASDEIKDKLKQKYGMEIAFYVDGDSKKINNKQVFPTERLDGRSSDYYVVIPLAFYESVREKMVNGGYREKLDYYYFSDCVVCQKDDYYEDAHGNRIIGKYQGLKFAFSGFHSLIQIGDDVCFQDTSIFVHNNSKILIGNGSCFQDCEILAGHAVKVEFGEETNLDACDMTIGNNSTILLGRDIKIYGKMFHKTTWILEESTKLRIGSHSFLFRGYLCLSNNSCLQIGKEFSIGEDYCIRLEDYTVISIGDDCMFSNCIYMQGGDGHSIFDVVTGENINSTYEIAMNSKIDIGSHVWVGMKAAILYHTKIGDGSIVGALSLVKNVFPNNCILAGVPAKVIRKDISWSRKCGAENIAECGYQYVNITK